MIVYLCSTCNDHRDRYCLNYEPGRKCESCGVDLTRETYCPVNEDRLAEVRIAPAALSGRKP